MSTGWTFTTELGHATCSIPIIGVRTPISLHVKQNIVQCWMFIQCACCLTRDRPDPYHWHISMYLTCSKHCHFGDFRSSKKSSEIRRVALLSVIYTNHFNQTITQRKRDYSSHHGSSVSWVDKDEFWSFYEAVVWMLPLANYVKVDEEAH